MERGQEKQVKDVVITSLDNLDKAYLPSIAELIYDTDSYIYPSAFGEKKQAVLLITGMLAKEDTFFCGKNIFVALFDGVAVGIAVLFIKSMPWNRGYLQNLYGTFGIPYSSRAEAAENEYFIRLFDKKINGIYISNICVEQAYRNQGIGTNILNAIKKLYPSVQLTLDVLSDNNHAIALYTKCGFERISTQVGYGDGVSVIEIRMVCSSSK